jgi:hypothetical protein
MCRLHDKETLTYTSGFNCWNTHPLPPDPMSIPRLDSTSFCPPGPCVRIGDGLSSVCMSMEALPVPAAAPRRARVHVIYTGGTLGMKPSADAGGSLAPCPGFLSSRMASMEELAEPR